MDFSASTACRVDVGRYVPRVMQASDRRSSGRFRIHLPVAIHTGDETERVGVTQNASPQGLLINTPSRLQPGANLKVSIRNGRASSEVTAHVVRVESVSARSSLPFAYLTAVELDDESPVLAAFATHH